MELHFEQNTCNAIDLIDENGEVVASVNGANDGDEDITSREEQIANLLCQGFNLLPESEIL